MCWHREHLVRAQSVSSAWQTSSWFCSVTANEQCEIVNRWVKRNSMLPPSQHSITYCKVNFVIFYVRGSVYRNSRFCKSNKMQHYADMCLLLNYFPCFRRPSRPTSEVHTTVFATSGTDHTIWGTSFLRRPYLVIFEEDYSADSMICTRGCNYSFMYCWSWARWTPGNM